ncbi:MAG: TonB-dependent receptor domain-containing protein [Candidatus Zixiibacteriota bacterium]
MPNTIKRIALIATLFVIIGTMQASNYGKIAGTVTDAETGEPLISANVSLFDSDGNYLSKGAATDWDGNYFILQIKPGVYSLRFTFVGYDTMFVDEVRVSTDRTTTIDVELNPEVGSTEVIRVTAAREKIEKDVTTTTQYTTTDDIDKMPVTSVEAVLARKVGVVSHDGQLHYRGGRSNEVAHYVDGMPVKDQATGGQALSVSTNAVQEVSVQTGTFQAEYGGAMSAIVNVVTKEGNTNKNSGSVTFSTDDFGFEALNKFSTNTKQLQFSLSGPEPISTHLLPMIGIEIPRDKRISYFFSINGQNSDTWLKYNYKFDFDDIMYTQEEITTPYKIDYGWYGLFPEARQNAYQMTFKLKQDITPSIKYTLSYAGNIGRQRLWNWEYLYTPVSSYVYESYAHQANITFTHNLSPKTYYEVKSGLFFTQTEYSPNGYTPGDFAVDTASYWNTLDDWHDVNNDGIPQVRQQWLDQNGNGMYDYGEIFIPSVVAADTIVDGTGMITRIDTVYVDSLPPQMGEEPWYDLNNNGIFEPKRTNYNTSYYGSPMDVAEPYMDGEPFRDGYSRMMNDAGELVQIDFDDPSFRDDTMWVDINGNGIKDYGEWVFGTYYSNAEIALEETTWHDLDGDGNPDPGEYRDINKDGMYTTRDKAYSGYKFPEFTDLNGNGRYDVGEPGEPFLDMNGNGYWDPPNFIRDDYEPYIDLNGNEQWDGPDGFMDRGMQRWAVWNKRKSTTWVTKADLTSQVNRNNQVKTGLQFELINIEKNQIQYPEGYYDGDPDGGPWPERGVFRSFFERSPKQLAFYVQDKMEYGGFIANVGIRTEVFIQADEVLEDSVESDLTRVIGDEIGMEIIPSRSKVSPRLGMSYPVTDRAKLFFSYGHFYQLPAFDNFYTTPNQSSSAAMLFGNPELDFEKTVQYEIGLAYALNDLMTVQFAGYYKDIFNHINTTTVKKGPMTFSLYENVDYGRGRGLEFTLEKGYDNFWAFTANYQFAYAYGKSSSDRSGYDARLDQTAIPLRDLPLDWDQRHHVTFNLDFSAQKGEHPEVFGWKMPDNWSMNFVLDWGTGFPYTPSVDNPNWEVQPGEKAWERTNALRKPNRYNVDFRFIKNFSLWNLDYIAYLDVKNVTNRRNIDDVYADTGLPDDPFSTDGLGNALDYYSEPTRWSSPRTIQVGLKMNW